MKTQAGWKRTKSAPRGYPWDDFSRFFPTAILKQTHKNIAPEIQGSKGSLSPLCVVGQLFQPCGAIISASIKHPLRYSCPASTLECTHSLNQEKQQKNNHQKMLIHRSGKNLRNFSSATPRKSVQLTPVSEQPAAMFQEPYVPTALRYSSSKKIFLHFVIRFLSFLPANFSASKGTRSRRHQNSLVETQ